MKSKAFVCVVAALLTTLAVTVEMSAQDGRHLEGAKHHRYEVVDLGTFGGPGSSVSGEVHILTPRGVVAGGADTTAANPNPGCFNPFSGGTDCSAQHAFQWRDGILTDLGVLPGGSNSFPYGINAKGWVVGGSENGTFDAVLGIPEFDATLWHNGQITNLGTLGGNESLAGDVNGRGQIVGFSANAVPDSVSMFGFATETRPFLWENGVMRDLDTLGSTDGAAFLMNERGQIMGQFYVKGTTTIDPMFWDENGVASDLGSLGGTNSTTWWLNNLGQVVGTSNLAGDATHHGFLWGRGALSDLGTLGGDNSEAFAINDDGEVTGRADVPGSVTHHGFLWRDGVMTDLGVPGTDPCSSGNAINSKGQIVGDAGVCFVGGDAWLWENGGPIVDLNTLVLPGSGMHFADAKSINDRGEIVCTGVLPNGDQHAVLLIPVDDDDRASHGTAAVQSSAPYLPDSAQLPPQSRWKNRYHMPSVQPSGK